VGDGDGDGDGAGDGAGETCSNMVAAGRAASCTAAQRGVGDAAGAAGSPPRYWNPIEYECRSVCCVVMMKGSIGWKMYEATLKRALAMKPELWWP